LTSGEIRAALARSPYFSASPDAFLDQLARLGTLSSYPSSHLLCRRTEKLKTVWVVVQGGLQARFAYSRGTGYLFGVLGPGQVAGAATLFPDIQAALEIRTVGRTTLVTLGGAEALRLLNEHAGFWKHAARAFYGRMHYLVNTIVRKSIPNTLHGRIARALIEYNTNMGWLASDAERPRIEITQTQLASMVDSSRARVSAALQDLQRDGAIGLEYRGIVLLDMAKLTAHLGS